MTMTNQGESMNTSTIVYFNDGHRAELLDDHDNGWVTVQYVKVILPCQPSSPQIRYIRGTVADRRAADIVDRYEIRR